MLRVSGLGLTVVEELVQALARGVVLLRLQEL